MSKDLNPQFSKQPVVEAVFDIRFKQKDDYSLMLGKITNAIDGYSVAQVQPANNFPTFPLEVSQGLIRHRFSDEEKNPKNLYQLGIGVLSVNRLKPYGGFADFSKKIEAMLEVLSDNKIIDSIEKVSLRYINKIKVDNPKIKIWSTEFNTPKILKDDHELTSTAHKFTAKNKTGEIALLISEVDDEYTLDIQKVTLDIKEFNKKVLLDWLKNGHQDIFEAFKGCLSKDYIDYIK